MNQHYYEQKELTERFGESATLGDVFHQIEKDLSFVNEVVCQFTVNGLALDEQGEKRLATASLKEVESLAVQSETPLVLLGNVLDNWVQKLPELIQSNDTLSEEIRFKGVEGQLKNLVDLIDEAQLLVDTIISIDTVFPHMAMVCSEPWKNAQKLMAQGIGESLKAFEKKDFTWLADILEYDLGHCFQTWMELLESLRQDVQNAKPGNAP